MAASLPSARRLGQAELWARLARNSLSDHLLVSPAIIKTRVGASRAWGTRA